MRLVQLNVWFEADEIVFTSSSYYVRPDIHIIATFFFYISSSTTVLGILHALDRESGDIYVGVWGRLSTTLT